MAKDFGILFDLDGTLVDNEHLKALSFSRVIEQLGGKSHPSIYEKVMGMSGTVIRNRFVAESNIQVDSNNYIDLYRTIYEDLLQTKLEIKPGVVNFLSDIKSAGIKTAIVSGSYKRSVNWIIRTLDIGQYLDAVITGDDVKNKKPDPDCFLMALERINMSKENVMVFEDTEAGLRAAHNAGLKSLGIRHSYNQSHDFSYALNEYSSFEDDIDLIKRDINMIFDSAIL